MTETLTVESLPPVDLNTQRANEVIEAMDPDHAWPTVDLQSSLDPGKPRPRGTLLTEPYHLIHDGVIIGEATVSSDIKAGEVWLVVVNEQERGKGYGNGVYKAVIGQALTQGYSFRTHDWSQSPPTRRIWERLAEQGIAREVTPFTPDGNGNFNGHYVIDPAQPE